MPRSTLPAVNSGLSPSRLKSRLPLSVLASLLASTVASGISPALAAPDAVPLLTAQCVEYSSNFQPEFQDLQLLERQTLGLHNINDRLGYYRSFPLSAAQHELLLQCQLKLADTMDRFLSEPALISLTSELNQDDEPQLQALAQRLDWLMQQHLGIEEKARLHGAQASIRQGMRSDDLKLELGQCALPGMQQALNPEEDSAEQEAAQSAQKPGFFAVNIASYLMQQADGDCRAKVWRTYQGRARLRNQLPLSSVFALRQQQAKAHGYPSYSDFILSSQLLSTPSDVARFLDASTQKLDYAPWDLGRELQQAQSTEMVALKGSEVLKALFDHLKPLGLTAEQINDDWLRVYHHGRLLGELLISEGKHNRHKMLRRAVVGQQTGQSELVLKPQQVKLKDYQTAVSSLSAAIAQLSGGGRYYLNNSLELPLDGAGVGKAWLERYLSDAFAFSLKPAPGSREQLAEEYQQQLKVFRAKVALASFEAFGNSQYPQLHKAFEASFNGSWPEVSDYSYSFGAISDQGPLYYLGLWQQQLAKAIDVHTRGCNPAQLFDLLLVNESAQPMVARLQSLFGAADAATLIRRIRDANTQENRSTDTCPLPGSDEQYAGRQEPAQR
ncbi:M3 family metallopeptidase [Shewanella algae]|uniref:M3 family metallopeptidase n=1 Tax=Shewanella algae TaxID=38313 RepID=UPI0031F57091